MAHSDKKIWESKMCRVNIGVNIYPFSASTSLFFDNSENSSAIMDCPNSKTKCVIYHGTRNQYLHTCGKPKFQNGRQNGRRKAKIRISQVKGQLHRNMRSRFS